MKTKLPLLRLYSSPAANSNFEQLCLELNSLDLVRIVELVLAHISVYITEVNVYYRNWGLNPGNR